MVQGNPGGALAGVRVLDLADETGVFGAKLLSDLGADVLRIEPPAGDPLRSLGPFADDLPAPDRSLSHWWFNSGKRSAVIDARTDAGRRQILDLAAQADIVFETGDLGLDLAAVRAEHPEVTLVTLTGYGLSGPHRAWLAPDLAIWARSGAMIISGLPDRYPLRANWALANQVGGLSGAVAGLAGLYHRRTTGAGLRFDISRLEALASLQETAVHVYLYNDGRLQGRQGLGHPFVAPYGAFPTRDGRVAFIALTQGQWTTLITWMAETGDVDPWLLDESLMQTANRAANRERVDELISAWTCNFTSADLVREANERRLPCAPINTALSVLDDEQLQARGFFVPVDQPAIGRTVLFPGLPYQFPGNGGVRPAPRWQPDAPAKAAFMTSLPPDSPTRRDPLPPQNWGGPRGGQRPPLGGLNVLDFTWALAGPQGTRVLADLGARVVKIEPREVGDIIRGLGPHWKGIPDPNTSGFHHRLNVNKPNLTVDLKKPEGLALIRRLVAWADVVIDNFGAGVLNRLGLGHEDLTAINPAVIQVSLSGYGQTGPTRNYPSFAQIAQARSGLVSNAAYPDGEATGPGISIGDTGAGLQLAMIVGAAVEQRYRTGQGCAIDMSQFEAAVVLIGPSILEATVNGRVIPARGNLLPDRDAAPHGVYPAGRAEAPDADRWIVIAAMTEDHWRRLANLTDRADLIADPRFATAADRVANADALDAIVGAWTRDQEPFGLVERLQAAGTPAAVVQNGADLLERDPQLAARGFYATVEQAGIGPVQIDSSPMRWTDGPVPITSPAMQIGEGNDYVLREILGLADEEIVELIIAEAI